LNIDTYISLSGGPAALNIDTDSAAFLLYDILAAFGENFFENS